MSGPDPTNDTVYQGVADPDAGYTTQEMTSAMDDAEDQHEDEDQDDQDERNERDTESD